MARWWFVLIVVAACKAQAPVAPSFFDQQHRPQPPPPPSCQDTVACYATCGPADERCMQACDQRTTLDRARDARALSRCLSNTGCGDEECVKTRCTDEVAACPANPPPS